VIDVEVPYETEVRIGATRAEAFALLADVGRSGSHFPSVSSLTDLGAGRWRWQMAEKGVGPVKMQASYEAVYTSDEGTGRVEWKPAPGRHDMDSYGSWTVVEKADGVYLQFRARTVAHIAAPRMMKKMVEAFAGEEIARLKQQYVAAIARSLGG
jgi:carbon monoxide dehydrogenase subunit G